MYFPPAPTVYDSTISRLSGKIQQFWFDYVILKAIAHCLRNFRPS